MTSIGDTLSTSTLSPSRNEQERETTVEKDDNGTKSDSSPDKQPVYHTPETYRISRRNLRKENNTDARILPWEEVIEGPQSLFKTRPPTIKYPTGVTDPNQIRFYTITMEGFLRSSPAVKQVIDGRRAHPFTNYKPLYDFAASQGMTKYTFDTSTTFNTIKWVTKHDPTLATQLKEAYNFGGIYSYSSINESIYMTYFTTLNPATSGGDLHIISSCEQYDGITARMLIMNSLRTLRTGDISTTAYRHSKKISLASLPMRIGGAAAYFGVIDEHRDALMNMDQPLPDTEIVGRIFEKTKGLHEEIDNTIRKLRRRAGRDNTPLTYDKVKHDILDTFKYDVPDIDKTAPPNTPILPPSANGATPSKRSAALAFTPGGHNPGTQPQQPPGDDTRKRKRPTFPKGSCKHHPDSTSHTTAMCYTEKRNKKGCPPGRKWCTFHKRSLHYEDECFRHKKNKQPPTNPATTPSAAPATIGANIAFPFAYNPHPWMQPNPYNAGWGQPQPPRWAPSGMTPSQPRAQPMGPPANSTTQPPAQPTQHKIDALVANINNLSDAEKHMLTACLAKNSAQL